MISRARVRLLDNQTFQEVEPPPDLSRPVEWRAGFNQVRLPLSELRVERIYSFGQGGGIAPLVKELVGDESNGSLQRVKTVIRAKVVTSDMRDSIYHTVETEVGTGVYSMRRPDEPIEVSLVSANSPATGEGASGGNGFGSLFRSDFEPGRDYLCMEVEIPEQDAREIVDTLKSSAAVTVELIARIRSFSSEGDDAFRQWHHARDLFIHGSAPAQVTSIAVRVGPTTAADRDRTPDHSTQKSASTTDSTPTQLQSPSSTLAAAKTASISWALWVIAIALVAHLLR